MKTKIKVTVLTAVLTILFTLFNLKSNAQCTSKITNQLTCDVIVDIVVYDGGGSCTNVCITQMGVTIPAASTMNITCSGCSSVCNIEVTVTDVNGSQVNPAPVANFTNGIQGFPASAGCGANDIRYDSGGDTFKIN